eukprot:Tamp_15346.p1 GENE.Tamp_15346~~Tamp_15346.p1  ORF type:complete len:440 (-),score=50.20 Tamp_15346:230-1462(-)
MDDDDDEIEVGCHGAKRPGDAGRSRRKLMAVVLLAAGVLVLVPAAMGFTQSSTAVNDALVSWLSHGSDKSAANSIDKSAANSIQLQYPVVDHLQGANCSFDALREWARQRGIEAPKVHVAEIKCAECPEGKRRGVTASAHIDKGEAIVHAPWAALITHELSTIPALRPAMALLRNATRLPSLDALALSLMFSRFYSLPHGESPYRPYLCFLPTEHGGPIFWDDARLQKYSSSSSSSYAHEVVKRVSFFKTNQLVRYNKMFPLLFREFPHLFHPEVHTVGAFLWASAMVESRNWFVNRKRPPQIEHALVPVADMINHRLKEGGGGKTDSSGSRFQLVAGSSFEPGEEVFTDYGTHCNLYYLLVYGFEIPDNKHKCHGPFPKVFQDPALRQQNQGTPHKKARKWARWGHSAS